MKSKLSEKDRIELRPIDFSSFGKLSLCAEQMKILHAKLYNGADGFLKFIIENWLKNVVFDNRLDRDLTPAEKLSHGKLLLQRIIDFILSKYEVIGKPTPCYAEHLMHDGHILSVEIIATDAYELMSKIIQKHF